MEREFFNGLQANVYAFIAAGGILMRGGSYNWFDGHLSDIAIPAQLTSMGLIMKWDNKYTRLASLLIPPVVSTLGELGFYSISSTYDPQDIACYFAGSFMAYGLSKANEKGVFGKISKKMKNMFNKKSLEDLAED